MLFCSVYGCMLCLVRYLFVISTSVMDCLGRFVPKMTYYVSSGTLNIITKLKLKFCTCPICHVTEIYVDRVFGRVLAEAVQPSADKKRRRDEHGPANDCAACLCHRSAASAYHSDCYHHTVRPHFLFAVGGVTRVDVTPRRQLMGVALFFSWKNLTNFF